MMPPFFDKGTKELVAHIRTMKVVSKGEEAKWDYKYEENFVAGLKAGPQPDDHMYVSGRIPLRDHFVFKMPHFKCRTCNQNFNLSTKSPAQRKCFMLTHLFGSPRFE